MRRGGAPALVSIALHAAMAATIGGVLGATRQLAGPVHELVDADVDVALVSGEAARPPAAPAAPATPTARPAAHRRLAPHPLVTASRHPETPSSMTDAPSVPVTATDPDGEAPARFALSAGTVATGPALSARSSAGSSTTGASGPPVAEGEADARARLLSEPRPAYPAAAAEAGIEADVPLEIVVDASGRVVSAHAVGRAGYGLDEAAEAAIRAYRFAPALRAGRPYAVRVRWTMQFRLR
jgi:protein TonB